MLLSDIFSIPFLICLAICILLIGCSSIYFYQRIMQQDHKIASMVSLISSMAEEPISGGSNAATTHAVPASVFRQSDKPSQCPIQQLIAVSDDEESSDEDESSDYEASDYDDNSDYSETSSENDGEEHILSAVDFDDLNVDLETSETLHEMGDEVEELHDLLKEEKEEKEEGPMLDAPLLEETPMEDTTKSIHLDADVTDFTIFKSINISDDHAQPEETSYKKMSLTKLREIAQLNGHSDVSKLKKPELLKLLEAE